MTEQIEIIDQIDYFPFLRAFWSTDGTYEKLTEKAKQAHLRQTWQLLARDQPQIMQMLNKSYDVEVLDALHEASKHANRQPQYCYIKARPANAGTLSMIKKFSKQVHDEFRKIHNVDNKEFDFFCHTHPDIVIESMKEIESNFKQFSNPKKRKR